MDDPPILAHPALTAERKAKAGELARKRACRAMERHKLAELESPGCALLSPIREGEGPIFAHGDGVKACSFCGTIACWLCDFPMGGGVTCDALLCDFCAVEQDWQRPIGGPTIYDREDESEDRRVDFCPAHAAHNIDPDQAPPVVVD